jgi:hypothetical protein
VVAWVKPEGGWLFDIFMRGEPSEGFEVLGEIVCGEKISTVLLQLLAVFVAVALRRCFFECAIHALDLPVGTRGIWFGQPLFDAMTFAGSLKRMAAQHRIGPLRFFGRSANWIPSISNIGPVRNGLDQSINEGG